MNNQQPLLAVNRLRNNNQLEFLLGNYSEIVIPIFNGKILMVCQQNGNNQRWMFPYDILDNQFEIEGNQPNYIKAANRIVDSVVGIRENNGIKDLGALSLYNTNLNSPLHVILYQIHPNTNFNFMRFSNMDGIIQADLIDYNKLIQLISNGRIRDMLTLSVVPLIAGVFEGYIK